MQGMDDFTVAILGACMQRTADAGRAAMPHVRSGLRRFREALGTSSLVVGPVNVSLAPAPRAPARIVAGSISTARSTPGATS